MPSQFYFLLFALIYNWKTATKKKHCDFCDIWFHLAGKQNANIGSEINTYRERCYKRLKCGSWYIFIQTFKYAEDLAYFRTNKIMSTHRKEDSDSTIYIWENGHVNTTTMYNLWHL